MKILHMLAAMVELKLTVSLNLLYFVHKGIDFKLVAENDFAFLKLYF